MEDSPLDLQKQAELFLKHYRESVHAPTKWERLADFLFEVYGNGLVDKLDKDILLRHRVEAELESVRRQNDEVSLRLSEVNATVNDVVIERDALKNKLQELQNTFAGPQSHMSQIHQAGFASDVKSMNGEHETPCTHSQVVQSPSKSTERRNHNQTDECALNENGTRKAVWEAIGMPLPTCSKAITDQHGDGATTPPQTEKPRATARNSLPKGSASRDSIHPSIPCSAKTSKDTWYSCRSSSGVQITPNCEGRAQYGITGYFSYYFGNLINPFLWCAWCHNRVPR